MKDSYNVTMTYGEFQEELKAAKWSGHQEGQSLLIDALANINRPALLSNPSQSITKILANFEFKDRKNLELIIERLLRGEI